MGIYACMRFYYLVSAETFVTLVNLKKNKMNKKQKDMLKQCRYYYGEEKCDLLIPNNDIEWF